MLQEEFKSKLDNRELWGCESQTKEIWEAAKEWLNQSNKESSLIKWSWDCGLKLDYDGEVCKISSRFYPPHKHSIEDFKYSGDVSVYIGDEEIHSFRIESKTLDDLKFKTEEYVLSIVEKITFSIKKCFK